MNTFLFFNCNKKAYYFLTKLKVLETEYFFIQFSEDKTGVYFNSYDLALAINNDFNDMNIFTPCR